MNSLEHCGRCHKSCGTGSGQVCHDGQCSLVCPSGHADCDQNISNGCEVQTTSNTNHCGACGHDCLDLACNEGLCTPEVVASSIRAIERFDIDSSSVYWNSGKNVFKAPKRGGAPTPIATALAEIQALAVHDNTLYFIQSPDHCELMRVQPDGVLSKLSSVQCNTYDLAIAGQYAYWRSGFSGPTMIAIARAPLAGGAETFPVPQSFGAKPFAVTDQRLVFADDKELLAIVQDQLAVKVGSAEQTIQSVQFDETDIYYLTDSSVYKTAWKSADSATRLLDGLTHGTALLLSPTSVVISSENRISRVDKTTGHHLPLTSPNGITRMRVDSTHVYWTDGFAEKIQRIAH